MSDSDKSLYSLRYNQVTSNLEAFGGGSPQWTPVSLNNVDPTQVPITRLINTTAPLQGGGNLSADRTIFLAQASSGIDGYLSGSDWITFEGKLSPTLTAANLFVGNGSNVATGVSLSGDASISTAGVLTLNTVNSGVGTFMNATITVNAKGLITAASAGTVGNLTDVGTDGITITGGTGAVIGTGTSISQHVADATHNGYLSSTDWSRFNSDTAGITALTGDVTATGPGSAAATLATVNASPGTTTISSITTNAKGLVTANSSATTTGSGSVVLATSPVLTTPNLGTPSSLIGTNITGTAAGLTAGTVTTNANLTGVITSVGNATSIASQTGTGTKFVVDTSPTLVTPILGAATVTSLNSTFIGMGRNRIINGDCFFDQVNEGGSAYTASTSAHYTLDQWRVEATGTPKFTAQQSSTVPTGFTKSIVFTTSVSGTPASGDGCNIEQPIAGPYIRDFSYGTANAVTLTLQFWVRASVTGTYSISFLNGTTNRSYVSTYTVNSANTFEFKTITFVGDTTGTWTTATNTFGMKVVWDAGSGSTVTTSTLNSWQAGSFWKASGSVSLVANAAATLYITGAQLEIGSTATAFEYLPYYLALMGVQQFVYKTLPQGTAWASGQGAAGAIQYIAALPGTTVGGGVYIAFPTTMLGTPGTVSTFSTINGGGNTNWWNATGGAPSGAPTTTGIGDAGLFIQNPQVTADNGGDVIGIQIKVSAQLGGV